MPYYDIFHLLDFNLGKFAAVSLDRSSSSVFIALESERGLETRTEKTKNRTWVIRPGLTSQWWKWIFNSRNAHSFANSWHYYKCKIGIFKNLVRILKISNKIWNHFKIDMGCLSKLSSRVTKTCIGMYLPIYQKIFQTSFMSKEMALSYSPLLFRLKHKNPNLLVIQTWHHSTLNQKFLKCDAETRLSLFHT